MKYKTTIQITTDAADKNEALEIVGDYLSGNIVSGIEMKCRTAPTMNQKTGLIVVSSFLLIIFAGTMLVNHIRNSAISIQLTSGMSAVQPPLKTSYLENHDADFKKDWQDRQTKKALEYIKR